jgi:FkbM family methyltransferase
VRLHEIPPLCLDGVDEVIDVSLGQVDLRRHLRIPESVRYVRCAVEDAEKVDPGPGALLLGLVGAVAATHTAPDALAPVLRRMRPGARALLLPAWPVEELPYHQLAGPLADARCQVVEAVLLEETSIREVRCALIVECVDRLAPLRALPPEAQPGTGHDEHDRGDLPVLLRFVNGGVLADLVVRQLRLLMTEKDLQARVMRRELRQSDARLRDASKALSKSRERLAGLKASTALRIGQAAVRGARHPVRAIGTVPLDLVRAWRSHRRREQTRVAARPAAAKPAERVVPIALPPGAQDRALITMTTPTDLLVPKRIEASGLAGYEPGALACFLAAMDVAHPGAVLDIGANVGIYAALASAVTTRDVRAFEPAPTLVAACRRLATDNDLGYRTESLALGAENGSATFYLSDVSDSSNSLAEGFRPSSAQIEVQVETLDSYVARTGAVPAVLKVDTETTEPDVLAGAAKTIAEHRPWILCEVLSGRVQDRLTEVLMPFGYHWYHIDDHVPYQEATEIAGDPTLRHLMWLFAPELPDDDFWAALRAHSAALAECTPQRGIDLSAGHQPAGAVA